MVIIAVVIFASAAFGGLVLASHVVKHELAPWALSIGHASMGATGLSVLGYALWKAPHNNTIMLSLVLFTIAAMGGFTLASYHFRKKIPPKGAILLHAVMAVSGFLVLISTVLL